MKTRQKLLLIGGLTGLALGLAAAFLYTKANEERIAAVEAGESERALKLTPASGLAIGLSIVGLLRQIINLGQE